jgi:non-specific protein-tyrosine kinase
MAMNETNEQQIINDQQIEYEGKDLRQYLAIFWHWLWLILLITISAGVVSFFISLQMTAYYESSTTLLVNQAPATQATDYSSVLMSKQLTSTYSEMITTDTVLKAVITQLGLTIPLDDLREMISITPKTDTALIIITVETTDPYLSANIANTISTVFASQIQDIQTQRFSQSIDTLNQQLADIETQRTALETQASQTVDPIEKARLDDKITQYNELYTTLMQSLQEVQLSEAQSVSSVVQVEPASPNLTAVKPKITQNMILAAMISFLLTVMVIFIREALDDTIKTPDEIGQKFNLPVLGVINRYDAKKGVLITVSEPRSPTAEAYRTLRTNVSYTSVDKPLHTVMITSTESGEGKTTTISNLGVVLAQNGYKVTIVDCDLRHPKLHTYFGLPNRAGLSTLFAHPNEIPNGAQQATMVKNLNLLTTGQLPPNPAELLGSKKMQSILLSMCQKNDLVLVDVPPVLAVTDAAVLAPSIDGVILVVRPGKTRTIALRATITQLRQVNATLLGVVINDMDMRGRLYSHQYKYYRDYTAYQNYYTSTTSKKSTPAPHKKK